MNGKMNDVKFVSNSINLGKVPTFDEIVEKYASKNSQMVKEASVKETEKEKDEAESSGQPEAEAKLVNHPKVLDEKEAEATDETKEAGVKGNCSVCGKPNFLNCGCKEGDKKDDDKEDDNKEDDKEEDKEDKDCTAKVEVEVKEASGSNEDDCAESSGQLDVEPLHQKGESEKPGDLSKKEKEASDDHKFVKIAKLNAKTRTFLRDYYSTYYPPEFVEALLAEK